MSWTSMSVLPAILGTWISEQLWNCCRRCQKCVQSLGLCLSHALLSIFPPLCTQFGKLDAEARSWTLGSNRNVQNCMASDCLFSVQMQSCVEAIEGFGTILVQFWNGSFQDSIVFLWKSEASNLANPGAPELSLSRREGRWLRRQMTALSVPADQSYTIAGSDLAWTLRKQRSRFVT